MSQVPSHIAIIMDGNGRWAEERGIPRYEGHKQGAKVVKEIVRTANELGVKYLTLYAFSSENWQRPKIEINALMLLLEEYLKQEVDNLKEKKIRIRAIGDLSKLPSKLQKLLEYSDQETSSDAEMHLILALSYGGRQEIVDATKKIIDDNVASSNLDQQTFENYLYAPDVPAPELLIRTSNEQRISNFLLWQLSYAEFVFVPEYWPDFSPEIFKNCLEQFYQRKRRFGDVGEGV